MTQSRAQDLQVGNFLDVKVKREGDRRLPCLKSLDCISSTVI